MLMRWLKDKTERSKECRKEANREDEERKDKSISNEMQYQVSVHSMWLSCDCHMTCVSATAGGHQ